MIRSKKDLREHIGEDLRMQGLPPKWRARYRFENRVVYYTWMLRRSEYWSNCRTDPFGRVAAKVLRFRTFRLGETLGISVGRNTCGSGLSIAHAGLTRINVEARVGVRLRIHHGCSIGHGTSSATGESGAPTIGDDVFIGPGAQVNGPVSIGDGAFVLPGAVVATDLPAGSVAGGVPAKVLRIEPDRPPWRPHNWDSLPTL